jgi:hypothetical protein
MILSVLANNVSVRALTTELMIFSVQQIMIYLTSNDSVRDY